MNISTYLRAQLTDHGWTPSELARQAGVSRQYVNSLINGTTTALRLDKAALLARALDVTTDDMVAAIYGDGLGDETVGARIASARGFRRMTQDQLGGLVGVTKQTVSGWERDRRTPDADDLVNLCHALNCSADYLLGLTDGFTDRLPA